MISFVISGEMRGKQRPRVTRRGHVYTPTETREAEAVIAKLAGEAMAGHAPFEGAVSLTIFVETEPPKSASKAARERMLSGNQRPTKKPDLDNIVKLISDAMNGVVYVDDKQVVGLSVWKGYAKVARTLVTVQPLAEPEE
jgi:Holliday junction resolvase RusA-like endonuclease